MKNKYDIDWDKPVLFFEEVHAMMGGKPTTIKDLCRDHPEWATPTKDGEFLIHRDRFVAWIGTGGSGQAIATTDSAQPVNRA